MSKTYITQALRERVALQAKYRCGYCLTRTAVVGAAMEFEHIIPESLGGLTEEENLWLACSLCNNHKADRMTALDSQSGEVVRLFDPRRQQWDEHFAWNADSTLVEGITPTGRATVLALQLNRPVLVEARRLWVSAGWHPPRDLLSPK